MGRYGDVINLGGEELTEEDWLDLIAESPYPELLPGDIKQALVETGRWPRIEGPSGTSPDEAVESP